MVRILPPQQHIKDVFHMEETRTIEQRVGDAILQKPKQFMLGTEKLTIAPPSVATLILASEAVSLLPNDLLDEKNIIGETLSIAKRCKPLGDICAILILGAKNLKEKGVVREEQEKEVEEIVYKSYLWGLFKRPVKVTVKRTVIVEKEVEIDRKAELSEKLLMNYSPRSLRLLCTDIIAEFQLGDFFGLTTFLIGINLLHPTKVEEGN